MKKLSILVLAMLLVFGLATTAFAAQFNGSDVTGGVYYVSKNISPLSTTITTDPDAFDNKQGNANATGTGIGVNDGSTVAQVIKSDAHAAGTQRTHGSYQNNTNSCASCHQTHTAAARNLLFKSGVYATCTACHDGTLGFYNVFANNTAADDTIASTAGTFGGTMGGKASVHNANTGATHKMAPGGNPNGTGSTSWAENFDCASCHAPHGSYSDRLLHYNPNNMSNTLTTAGGTRQVALEVYTSIPTFATGPAQVFLRTNGADAALAALTGASSNQAVTDAAYDAKTIIVRLKKGTTAYEVDNTPWLYGYDFYTKVDLSRVKMYWSAFTTGSATDANAFVPGVTSTKNASNDTASATFIQPDPDNGVHIQWGKSFAYADAAQLDGATYGNVSPVYVTKLIDDVDTPTVLSNFGGVDILKLNTAAFVTEGRGKAISAWCGACHTDYNTSSSASSLSMWGSASNANRHTTNSDSYACLRCHFAHGTDLYTMTDAKDKTVADLIAAGTAQATAEAYILDQNPSSALKRYTNMAVCWKCHTDSKATQLKNNDYFWTNYDTVPHGF